MEAYRKEKLKKNGFVSLIFLFLIALLFSLTFLDFFKENTFKNIVIEMLTSSPLCEDYKDIHSVEVSKKYTSLAFPSVFEVRNEEKQLYVFFVRLTGKYGTQTGFFLYDEVKGITLFCGIVGQDFEKQNSYYGINDEVINYWCNKISRSVQKN